MSIHRCSEPACPFEGQHSSRGCGCHKTDEQVMRAALETANVEMSALLAKPGVPDFSLACPNTADAECLATAYAAIRAAIAKAQPPAKAGEAKQ